MKELNTVLNILMGSFFGVFVGDLISTYRHYRQFQEIYDACERDNYLSAEEAVEFGLVDRILTPGGSLE